MSMFADSSSESCGNPGADPLAVNVYRVFSESIRNAVTAGAMEAPGARYARPTV
uniref:Uncharacterized protein n=1 Tax=Anopheles atroparvus TaxID=41427 RepID=A0AAG5DAV9_ANOAO